MPDKLCTVIKITFKGNPAISDIMTVMDGYPATLIALSSIRSEKTMLENIDFMEEYGDWKHVLVIEGWTNPEDAAEWEFNLKKTGNYKIIHDYSNNKNKGEIEGLIIAECKEFYFEPVETGSQIYHFYDHQIGMVQFDSPGIKKMIIHPLKVNGGKEFIKLKAVKLLPLE